MKNRANLIYKILMWFFWTVLVIMITVCFCDVAKAVRQSNGSGVNYEYNY